MARAKDRVEKHLQVLFSSLRHVDEQRIPENIRFAPKFLVARVAKIEVRMEGDKKHGRAHVHVKYEKDAHAGSYAIDNGARLVGEQPSYYDEVISNWIDNNKKDLQTLWKSTQDGKRNEQILLKFQTTVYD